MLKNAVTFLSFVGMSIAAVGSGNAAHAQSIPEVKYAGVAIFEGGKGDSWFDRRGTRHTPLWRLYVCLEKTNVEKSGQVFLDLAELGAPYEVLSLDEITKQPLFSARLSSLTLSYRYTAQVEIREDEKKTTAFGTANLILKSTQNWARFQADPDSDYTPSWWNRDLSLFDLVTPENRLDGFAQTTYQFEGTDYYLATTMDKFQFDSDRKTSNIMTECEKRNQPHFILQGNEIPRNPKSL